MIDGVGAWSIAFSHHQVVGHRVARLADHLDQLPVRVRVLEDFVGHQSKSCALAPISGGTTNSMYVRFNVGWNVEVDNNIDVVNVCSNRNDLISLE